MEKKYNLVVGGLALTGAVAAAILTYTYYYPGLATKFVVCGGEYAGKCDALTEWRYSALFGIPLAGYGLFTYLLIMCSCLVADYADGEYLRLGFFLTTRLVGLSLAADLVLAAVMLHFHTVCMLCVLTYVVNLLILLTCWLWCRNSKSAGTFLKDFWQSLQSQDLATSDRKAAAALYAGFVIFLAFAVFATAQIMQLKTASLKVARLQTKQAMEVFYERAPENPLLPESGLRIGPKDARVQIAVFSDFLCSACFQFFQLEQQAYAKYGDKISFVYYNYPLDQTCNSAVQQTVYKNSCTAAKAALSAAMLQIFPQYLDRHFARYQELHMQFDRDKALETASLLTNTEPFQQNMNSEEVSRTLQRDIALAENLHINATPTMFINGRRMEGVPPREVLEGIIERELQMAGLR